MEPAVVHGMNFIILLIALWSFEACWGSIIANTRPLVHADPCMPEWSLWCFGYVAFGSGSLTLTTPRAITPDLLVTVFVYWAAILTIRIRNGISINRNALLLGLVVGLGYLAKALFLPIGILIILCAVWARQSNLGRAITGALAFAQLWPSSLYPIFC